MSSRQAIALASMIACLCVTGIASAAPYTFIFADRASATDLTLTGVNAGDTITVTVVADNGASMLVSQSWFQADILSATVVAGSYAGTFNAPFFTNDPIFRTDATGAMSLALFFDTDLGNSDSLGGSAQLFNDGIASRTQTSSLFAGFAIRPAGDPSAWTVTAGGLSVPEPSSMLLVGLALAGLGMAQRRRAA